MKPSMVCGGSIGRAQAPKSASVDERGTWGQRSFPHKPGPDGTGSCSRRGRERRPSRVAIPKCRTVRWSRFLMGRCFAVLPSAGAFDSATLLAVREDDRRTGSVLADRSLQRTCQRSNRCDFFKLTATEGRGTGESFNSSQRGVQTIPGFSTGPTTLATTMQFLPRATRRLRSGSWKHVPTPDAARKGPSRSPRC